MRFLTSYSEHQLAAHRVSPLAWFAALLALWGVGLFARGYWTPDEPREAALSAAIQAHPAPLPALAGTTFAEKPPLTYWLAGAAQGLLGATPAATRAPQLLYALLGFVAVMALGRALAGSAAGLAAGLVFVTSELVYQVQIWLDTDALLLAGVCVALAGMYRGLAARASNERLRAYLVMHAGLTLAFFAKNFAAWLVPVLAFCCWIAIERRWRDLLRWELYAPALLPAACIGLWVHSVAAMPDGAHALRILFWNNLVGRALPVAGEAQYNYSSGHPNWPGKYALEMLLYLLPWTVATLAALVAAWRAARGPAGAPWRFALCAALPGLLVLSLANTARGIYAAPCLVGFALLTALWAARAGRQQRALRVTAVLIGVFALLLLGITVALQCTAQRASWPVFCISVLAATGVALWSWREQRLPAFAGGNANAAAFTLARLAVAWALLTSLGVLALYGAMNRAQDLPGLAARVDAATGAQPLLLWKPDETTLAMAQLYLPEARWSAIDESATDADAQLATRLAAAPATQVMSASHERGWSREQWLAYLRGAAGAAQPADIAAGATAPGPGLVVSTRLGRPGGRGYLLWSAPSAVDPGTHH